MIDPEWPRVKSSYYRNRCCDPCFICGNRQPRYDHFGALSCWEQRFIHQHFGRDIPGDGCMCRAHHKEARRHKCNPEYVPTWIKTKDYSTWQKTLCMFSNCKATSLHNKIIVPSAELQPQFSEVLNAEQPVAICATHYQYLYRQMHSPSARAGCGAKPKFIQPGYTIGTVQMLSLSLSIPDWKNWIW